MSSKDTPSLFKELDEPVDPWAYESELDALGYRLVAGVDEAGRGPLAGPVVAAAAILDNGSDFTGVTDSKKLKPKQREDLFDLIMARSRAVGLGVAWPEEIDRVNILQASLAAMVRAVKNLHDGSEPVGADYLLIDGTFQIDFPLRQRAVPHGDALSISIGAASIVAKVVRDRLMTAYEARYPHYGFASHKGYGTKKHLAALKEHGPCPIHRLTFKRVKED